MFEESLVISRVAHVSATTRWTAFASMTVQCALAALVIALPLLHPEALPFHGNAPRVLMPLHTKPPLVRAQPATASSAPSSETASTATQAPQHPTITLLNPTAKEDAPPISLIPMGTGMSEAIPAALATTSGQRSRISVTPARPIGPVRISRGVSEGLLITPIRPIYPTIARAAGVQGTVVVEAIISRTGTIESLRVISGPPMLQTAAANAIRAAHYQPYRLNGEPTEVQTTFTINFRIGE